MNVNEKCERLHILFNSMKLHRFEKSEIDSIGFRSGVYIIFEDGEAAHGGKRIVRIGTNTGEHRTSADRLGDHYEDEGVSIFRKHIARCLLEKESDADNLKRIFHDSKYLKRVRNWKKTAGEEELKKFRELHEAISAHIQNYCSFVLLPVCRESCEDWEKKIISTVATCPDCGPSPEWLGNIFPENIQRSCAKIRGYGLWNVEHVNDKHILTDLEIVELENIVELSRRKSI
jgi:hypothetical protein